MDEDNGAFADFVKQDLDLTWQVPDKMSDQDAATLPIPFFTACQVFYQRMGLPHTVPSPHGKWMLVYSGASSVGQYAIQLAKRSGFNVITTASPQRESRLKSLGADIVVDYRVRACFLLIYLVLQKKLTVLMLRLTTWPRNSRTPPTTVSRMPSTASQKTTPPRSATMPSPVSFTALQAPNHGDLLYAACHKASKGGEVVAILPIPENAVSRKDVKASSTILYTNLTGKSVKFGPAEFPPAGPHDREDAAKFYTFMPQFIVDSGIKYLEVYPMQGIDSIPEGLKLLQDGKVHGKKIVVTA